MQTIGINNTATYTPRSVLARPDGKYLSGFHLADGALSRDTGNSPTSILRPGLVMGKVTATGKYRPMIVGKSNLAYADNDTTIQVPWNVAVEVEKWRTQGGGTLAMKFIGPPTAAGTVAATDVTVSAVTFNGDSSLLTVGDLNLNKVTDSFLTLADGSQTPRGILDDYIRVTDEAGNDVAICSMGRLLIGGTIDATLIAHWPADTSTQAYLLSALNAPATGCGPFTAYGNF